MAINMDMRVGQYIELRNKIKDMEDEHEKKMAPYKQAKEKLGLLLLNALNENKQESARTIHGTVYKTEKRSASIVDKEAFWNFVVNNTLWELIDKRANANAVYEYAQEHKQKINGQDVPQFPPGLNYSAWNEVGVRKA